MTNEGKKNFKLGMDFSTLRETEQLGGKFYFEGEERELLSLFKEIGINSARLRLWVDPYGPHGEPYGGGTCDLDCVKYLGKRAKDAGMSILLDYHYSDFWCDPSRQLLPKAWAGLSFSELVGKVYEYTRATLSELIAADLEPEIVQIGNEITGGFLWPYGKLQYNEERKANEGFDRLAVLLKSCIKAVREITNAKIMLHLERSGDNRIFREFFDHMRMYDVDYDIIGVSYYPFWHGNMQQLKANLDDMAERYDKDIYLVETSYGFTGEHYNPESDNINLVINNSLKMADGSSAPYPLSPQGQIDFVRDLLNLVINIKNGKGKGFYYWEPAWLPVKGSTWSTESAREYINEQHKPGGNEWANQCLFDYQGHATPALKEFIIFKREVMND
jgi:arabinogalactan endo-1,4-beta-galactosidase